MRVRVWAAAAVLSLVPAVGALAKAPGVAHLVVRASASGRGTFAVTRTIRLPERYWGYDLPRGVIKTTPQTHAEVVISQDAGVYMGIVQDPELGHTVVFSNRDHVLLPGTYVVTVNTDHPVSIDLPLSSPGRSFVVTAGGRPRVARYTRPASIAPNVAVAFGSAPIRIRSGTVSVVALAYDQTDQQLDNGSVCITSQALPCEAGAVYGGAGIATFGGGVSTGSYRTSQLLFVYPGNAPDGNYYATGDEAGVGIQNNASLVVYTIDLTA